MSFLNQNGLSFSNASLNRVTYMSATGGTITTDGDYKVHTFLLADTGTSFTPSASGTVEYLVIGGGGGGGRDGGGGGAGGYRTASGFAVSAQAYIITVGDGGDGGTLSVNGANGVDSIFSTVTSTGGGGGKKCYKSNWVKWWFRKWCW